VRKGHIVTESTRNKIRAKMLGRTVSAEVRQQLSNLQKERWKNPAYRNQQIASHRLYKPTEVTKHKISETMKNRTSGSTSVLSLVKLPIDVVPVKKSRTIFSTDSKLQLKIVGIMGAVVFIMIVVFKILNIK